jgi:hypothetical protein
MSATPQSPAPTPPINPVTASPAPPVTAAAPAPTPQPVAAPQISFEETPRPAGSGAVPDPFSPPSQPPTQ